MGELFRTDKFAVGDKVTWADDHFATLVSSREKHGDGPFTIVRVENVSNSTPRKRQSTWESMGHTQHVEVHIDGISRGFSGAFFRKVDAA